MFVPLDGRIRVGEVHTRRDETSLTNGENFAQGGEEGDYLCMTRQTSV
jgi:hypothetical protein